MNRHQVVDVRSLWVLLDVTHPQIDPHDQSITPEPLLLSSESLDCDAP